MKCFLHIGTEATATTTLQNFLNLNRSKLYKSGFIYTRSTGLTNNFNLAVAAYDVDRRDEFTILNDLKSNEDLLGFQKKIFNNLREELRKATGSTIIFSSEHFQSRLTVIEEIQRLKKLLSNLGLDEVLVVVYLRNPAEIANSLYSSAVKAGHVLDSVPPPQNKYFANICNHRNTLEKFGSVFGKKALIPRIFHKNDLKNASIIDDFLDIVKAPNHPGYDIPPNCNKSLSATGIEILKRVNKKVPCFIEGKFNPARADIVKYFDKYFTNDKYIMPHEFFQHYNIEFQSSNEWVRSNFFPKKKYLFPQIDYPSSNKANIQSNDLDRIASMLANIWVDKQKIFEFNQ